MRSCFLLKMFERAKPATAIETLSRIKSDSGLIWVKAFGLIFDREKPAEAVIDEAQQATRINQFHS